MKITKADSIHDVGLLTQHVDLALTLWLQPITEYDASNDTVSNL